MTPRGVASMDPMGYDWQDYVGCHQILLNTKIQALGLVVSDKEIILHFPTVSLLNMMTPRGLANLDPRGIIGRIYVGYH